MGADQIKSSFARRKRVVAIESALDHVNRLRSEIERHDRQGVDWPKDRRTLCKVNARFKQVRPLGHKNVGTPGFGDLSRNCVKSSLLTGLAGAEFVIRCS